MTLLSQLASKISTSSSRSLSKEDLEGFKKAQKLAYQCAVDIRNEMREGWSEKQTADLMDTYLRDHKVRNFFHRSIAWFGDRSGFHHFTKYTHFLPSQRKLQSSDIVIIDTAPVVNGYAADIGYTFSIEPNPELEKAKKLLLYFREKIVEWFASTKSTQEIWNQVDAEMRAAGYDNAHSKYPFSVLGHRLYRLSEFPLPGLMPFSWNTYLAILSRGVFPELMGPHHDGKKIGIWAVEPHLAGKGFGAKFEEILVVDQDKVYWLDDEVPHVTEAK